MDLPVLILMSYLNLGEEDNLLMPKTEEKQDGLKLKLNSTKTTLKLDAGIIIIIIKKISQTKK